MMNRKHTTTMTCSYKCPPGVMSTYPRHWNIWLLCVVYPARTSIVMMSLCPFPAGCKLVFRPHDPGHQTESLDMWHCNLLSWCREWLLVRHTLRGHFIRYTCLLMETARSSKHMNQRGCKSVHEASRQDQEVWLNIRMNLERGMLDNKQTATMTVP
jgi:hypothetical protein